MSGWAILEEDALLEKEAESTNLEEEEEKKKKTNVWLMLLRAVGKLCAVIGVLPLAFVSQTVLSNWVTNPQHTFSANHEVLEALRTSTYKYCTNEEADMNITDQPCYELTKRFRTHFRDPQLTIVVLGPRGAGKTTLIQKELCGKLGVVHVPLQRKDTDFDRAVLKNLGISSEVSLGDALDDALRREHEKNLKGNRGAQPVIVFSVDSKASAEQVQDLLIWSKSVQFEGLLACIVVDISQSRVSLNLTINLGDLRTSIFHVPLMSEAEAKGMLGEIMSDADAEYAVKQIGSLPLHIRELVSRCTTSDIAPVEVIDLYWVSATSCDQVPIIFAHLWR